MLVATASIIVAGIIVAALVTDEKQRVAWYAAFVATAGLLFTGAKFVYDVYEK